MRRFPTSSSRWGKTGITPLAYAGISRVWVGRQQMGFVPSSEATAKAKEAALKALELDDSLAEAHGQLAVLSAWSDWDWSSAEAAFERAIELNPNYAYARALYSHYLIDPNMPYLGLPTFDSVPDDPRFQDLLRRMNLPV